MKKRIIATVLSMVMLASAMTGCGNQKNEATGESTNAPSTEKPSSTTESEVEESKEIAVDAFKGTTLEIAILKSALAKWDDPNDLEAFKLAEEATGIHIDWLVVDANATGEKMPLILSGNDRPDAYFRVQTDFISGDVDMYYDLSEEGLLETYAPNVLADHKNLRAEDGFESLYELDGSIRALYGYKECSTMPEAQGIMFMNKKWLDKVGMEVPTTAEEFYQVLLAFRDADANGNGVKDEIPFEFSKSNWAAQIMNLANSFGIAGESYANEYHYFKVEDSTVVTQADTEQFKAFLEYANKLASEGLLDIEGFSQAGDQYYTKLKGGLVGCYYGWTPVNNFGAEAAADWVTVKPFKALDDVEPVKTGTLFNNTYCKMFSLDKDCSNVEAALHWWNYISSSTEMKHTVAYGKQGVIWDIVDGVPTLFPESECKVEFSETYTWHDYVYTEGLTMDIAPLFLESEFMALDLSDKTALDTVRYYACEEIKDMLVEEKLPSIIVPEDKKEEINLTKLDVVEYIDAFVANSIVEGITDDTWEIYLEGLEPIGYYDWIDWMNEVYFGK